jgi:hypothetical protein
MDGSANRLLLRCATDALRVERRTQGFGGGAYESAALHSLERLPRATGGRGNKATYGGISLVIKLAIPVAFLVALPRCSRWLRGPD